MTPGVGVQGPRATAPVYLGLFCVTLATLMLELLLTRIFSATMWYHYAFVAISLALFGMTVGAVIVHVAPGWFPGEAVLRRMALAAWLFGVSTVLALLGYLAVPLVPGAGWLGTVGVAFLYSLLSVPFIFSGICVCLALTRFPSQVSWLYAADMAGAAVGCVALAFLLGPVDGLSAVAVVGAVAAVGGMGFGAALPTRGWSRLAGGSAVVLLGLGLANARTQVVQIHWARGNREPPRVYERWNAFSRIAIWNRVERPFGWGLSSECPSARASEPVDQKWLNIDAAAATVLTRFDGDPNAVDYLGCDVTAVAYAIEPQARVLVIGAGGGRDVLTGLLFGAREITAVEINGDIVRAVNGVFGEYTGHLDRRPGVHFVVADARSWVEASEQSFDLIQSSLIDTFAATSAGAFVLTENGIYTREAWASFLRHLSDRGVLSVSRWYAPGHPLEALRAVVLARAALDDAGIAEPYRHVVVVHNISRVFGARSGLGVITILVKKQPFSDADLDALEALSRRLHFQVLLSPRGAQVPEMATALQVRDADAYAQTFLYDISAPTDNRPFFFQMLRPRDTFHWTLLRHSAATVPMVEAALVLATLLLTVLVLTAACIVLPLWLAARSRAYRMESVGAGLMFFAAIGLGYLLIEISQMERLMIFLGHPMYGLTVALFSLLIFSSLGSFLTGRFWKDVRDLSRPRGALLVLLLVLGAFALLMPVLLHVGRAWPTAGRIGLALLAMAPLGLVMGMPFALGMRLAGLFPQAPTAWFWGINGAMSVCGSVIAMIISLASGISATFAVGMACYLIAVLAFWALERRSRRLGLTGSGAPAVERAM